MKTSARKGQYRSNDGHPNFVGTGLAPVRETVAHADKTGYSVPFTRLRTGASPVPTVFEPYWVTDSIVGGAIPRHGVFERYWLLR